MSHPPPARLSELCDSWEPDGPTLGTVKLQLKPSSATGYKGVNKVKKMSTRLAVRLVVRSSMSGQRALRASVPMSWRPSWAGSWMTTSSLI